MRDEPCPPLDFAPTRARFADTRLRPVHDVPDFFEVDGNRERIASPDPLLTRSLAIAALAYFAVVGGFSLVLLVIALCSADLRGAPIHANRGAQLSQEPSGDGPAAGSASHHFASVTQTGERDHGR